MHATIKKAARTASTVRSGTTFALTHIGKFIVHLGRSDPLAAGCIMLLVALGVRS